VRVPPLMRLSQKSFIIKSSGIYQTKNITKKENMVIVLINRTEDPLVIVLNYRQGIQNPENATIVVG
jgi:hypothetical protein